MVKGGGNSESEAFSHSSQVACGTSLMSSAELMMSIAQLTLDFECCGSAVLDEEDTENFDDQSQMHHK